LRAAFASVDPNQPISDVKTMDQRIALSLGPRRSVVALLTVFAAMALALAAIGLFGLVRFNVTQRVQEIGVRMALGAQPMDVLRMLVVQSGRLVLAGIVVGLVATLVLTRALASELYGVSSADPVSFAATAVILSAVALLAIYIPARRAMAVDPMVALRYE
jgi:putative ABC transport system permease protein